VAHFPVGVHDAEIVLLLVDGDLRRFERALGGRDAHTLDFVDGNAYPRRLLDLPYGQSRPQGGAYCHSYNNCQKDSHGDSVYPITGRNERRMARPEGWALPTRSGRVAREPVRKPPGRAPSITAGFRAALMRSLLRREKKPCLARFGFGGAGIVAGQRSVGGKIAAAARFRTPCLGRQWRRPRCFGRDHGMRQPRHRTGRRFLCPEINRRGSRRAIAVRCNFRGRLRHQTRRQERRELLESPRGRRLHARRGRTIEPFNEWFKNLFDLHACARRRRLDNNRTQLPAALFAHQILL